MPARVVLVFDEQQFVDVAVTAFREAGLDIMSYTNPTVAMTALERARSIELLITRAAFPAGLQNGVSLALTTKMSRPDVKVLFVAEPQYREITSDIGDRFLPLPVSLVELVDTAKAMLRHAAALPLEGIAEIGVRGSNASPPDGP